MLFAVNIITGVKRHYDMSYGKCLDPNGRVKPLLRVALYQKHVRMLSYNTVMCKCCTR